VPRYFFNIRDGKNLIDHEGTELSDIREAQSDAVLLAGRSIAEMGDAFWKEGEDWTLDVCDEAGVSLFTLRFAATRP
jgi:hypothetical protein